MVSGWTVGVVGDVGAIGSCQCSVAAGVWLGGRASGSGLLSAQIALHHLGLAVKLTLHAHQMLVCIIIITVVLIILAKNGRAR